MRTQTLALLALVAGAQSALRAQQAAARLIDRPATNELEIVVGPVDLPLPAAGEADGAQKGAHFAHHAVNPPIDTVEVPFDAYLHGARFVVVDGGGTELPPEVLHHLNLINPDRRELFAPISQRLLAMGSETGSQAVPAGLLGVPTPQGTRFVVSAMLHNPTARARRNVELHIYLKYRKAIDGRPRFVGFPFQLDVAFPAGDKDLDLPPGRSQFSFEASPAVAGKILVVLGHLHEHAVDIALEDVSDGRLIWRGLPVYDEGGKLAGVTVGRLYESSGAALSPEHTYRVTVTYDNPTPDTLFSGGMGVVGGVFVPDDADRWPDVDKSNPLYALDRLHYLLQLKGRYADIVDAVPGAAELYPPRRGGTPRRHGHIH